MEIQAPSPPASHQEGHHALTRCCLALLGSVSRCSFRFGFGPSLSRTPIDSRHSGVGILSTARLLEPILWPTLRSAGGKTPGVSGEDAGELPGHPTNHDPNDFWALASEKLLSHPEPGHKDKAAKVIDEHSVQQDHTNPTISLLLVALLSLLSSTGAHPPTLLSLVPRSSASRLLSSTTLRSDLLSLKNHVELHTTGLLEGQIPGQ